MEIHIHIESLQLYEVIKLLKTSLIFKINSLVDIVVTDWIWRFHRFSIYYNFYSFLYNYRLIIVIDVPIYLSNIFGTGVESLTMLFSSANWLEREVWDLFGIYFYNHPDLRRILTDYGFSGFPFRKDFPLTGFKELRYDDLLKIIIYEDVKLSQEFRVFSFTNPWY